MIVSVVASVHYKWQPMKVLKQVHFYQSLVLLWGAEITVVTFSSYFLFFLLFFAVFIPVLGLLLDGTVGPATLVEEMSYPICMPFLREPVGINCGLTFCHSYLSGSSRESPRTWTTPVPFVKLLCSQGHYVPIGNWPVL